MANYPSPRAAGQASRTRGAVVCVVERKPLVHRPSGSGADIEELPERMRKKLPRYPVPVLGLARLAVDNSARSMGLGSQLLRFVLKVAAKMADEVGCAGVVVDAKPGAVDFYAKYGFTPLELLEGQSDARPRPTAMWLPIQAIQKAEKPAR